LRLIGQQKMGFYPTPLGVVDLVRSWLTFPDTPFPALDPCAGEGEALARCVEGTAAVSYGIELDGGRVLEARKVLDRVLCADAVAQRATKTSHDSWSLLWANPPYDDTKEGGIRERMELTFLRKYTPRLVPRGVLVFIIPQTYAGGDVAKYLSFHYSDLRFWRFPDQLGYGTYKQVVILGRRKEKGVEDAAMQRALDAFALDGLRAYAMDVPRNGASYVVPPANADVEQFESAEFTVDEAGVLDSPLWSRVRGMLGEEGERQAGRPPVTPHKGHLALLLSSGEVDGSVGSGDLRHVVRGSSIKRKRIEERPGTRMRDGFEETYMRRFEVDYFTVSVTALRPDGTMLTISGAKGEKDAAAAGK